MAEKNEVVSVAVVANVATNNQYYKNILYILLLIQQYQFQKRGDIKQPAFPFGRYRTVEELPIGFSQIVEADIPKTP